MGQKVSPTGYRLGITQPWRSRWYANKADFGKFLVEDHLIRTHIKNNFRYAGVPRIEIERTREKVTIILHAARPGVIIGKQGKKVDELRAYLTRLCTASGEHAQVDLKIHEIEEPRLAAQLVAEAVSEQLEKRMPFRRSVYRAADECMQAGASGVRIIISGRLGGADMARRVRVDQGSIPLSTLRAPIDYGVAEARTTYGVIGVRVWIFQRNGSPMGTPGGADHGTHAKKVKAPKTTTR
jgi:small subunit ribosomal protein S3